MSADNWAECPRCIQVEAARITKMKTSVNENYGKVPMDEFEDMRAELETIIHKFNQGMNHTFREDYEFYGVESGTLEISYRGNCTVCGLTHKISESRKLNLES